jgi:hypothetical protein
LAANAGAEPEEVATAIGDVAYRLTHDPSNTPEDIRDALALAPIATVKIMQRGLAHLAMWPRRAMIVSVGLLLSTCLAGILLRHRRSTGK